MEKYLYMYKLMNKIFENQWLKYDLIEIPTLSYGFL